MGNHHSSKSQSSVDRREWLSYAAFGGAALSGAIAAGKTGASPANELQTLSQDRPKYDFKKSINLWAFPYPDKMSLKQCLQMAKDAGFDGIELNYDLDSDLSPKSGTKEFTEIRKMADEIGIAISGVCSFLFWPYPLTSNDPAERSRGMELASKMTRAAHDLGTENLLVVPGAVHMPWREDHDPTPNDVCDARAREAIGKLLPEAEKLGVKMNMENIFFNGFLMSPMEMAEFVDSFDSEHVRVHFDTGNIMEYQFPEHWIPILGDRIQNVHLKEYTKKGSDHSLEAFRPLLDGTTNWPAVLEAFDGIGYDGYLTFEYFHPYAHYPEALIYQTSDSLDRMLGRK
ncbi:sugar phosphate isomerase/epimerase family protein [Rhodopirellula halodulae]|uniref:sugar phosphate isomerase/epimerase family protein n=1 Tax=Rhodopirellula halodulae TaxID=2894198 RepID=UPI001E3B7073|nr:sugar phosphate isomerase/epimerase family protein [Rhodopirellula sp. JC737]MCC9656557.1 sugar phosphate isomerase/epimerase [Rhodopirellula sp. JC737]